MRNFFVFINSSLSDFLACTSFATAMQPDFPPCWLAAAPASAPAGPTAGLTDVQREAVLQWLGRRCAQQKATSFELLVRQVQASHQQQLSHMDAVRITRVSSSRPRTSFAAARSPFEII